MVVAIVRRSVTSSISRRYLLSNNNNHSSSYYYDYYYYYVQLFHFSTKTPPSAITTTPQIVFTEDYFVSKYQFSPGIASELASVSARLKKNPQNPDILISCLKECGFSNAHLARIIRHHPNLLSSCPERSVKPKLKIFHDLGFSADEATQLIARHPTILFYQPKRIIHSLDVYRRLLGSNDNVVKLIKRCASLLYSDPEKTVLPNIQFLNEFGIQITQINSCICTIPYFFTISPENMRRCVDKADEMGVDRTAKAFIYAAWAVCTMTDETLKLKLKNFQDLGFSQDDILRLFSSYPMVIAVSTRKIKEVKEVLLETGKYDMSCIIKCPVSLMMSVEKRYKPRLRVLKSLEEQSLITKWPGLPTLCNISNKAFFEKFVALKTNELGEAFIAMTAASGKPEMLTDLATKLR